MKEVSLTKMRWKLFLLGFLKIPMIYFVRPKLVSCNEEVMHIRIPINRRTKNHLKSMYFGALNIGADLAAGLFVYYHGERMGRKVSLSFKSSKGNYLKRPESDVDFTCKEGMFIQEKLEEAYLTNSRINFILPVEARNSQGDLVAMFEMEVSIRTS